MENRLTQVDYDDDGDGPNGLVPMATYSYDAQGRRVEYIDQTRSVTVRYAYDGANAIVDYEYDGNSLTGTRSYVHGTQYIDERAVMRDHAQDPVAGDHEVGQDHDYLLEDLDTERETGYVPVSHSISERGC